jgi:hypothetical protein
MVKPPLTYVSPEYAKRFRSRVDRRGRDECWPWKAEFKRAPEFRAAPNWKGFATHVALVLAGKPRPFPDAMALHSCDNRGCMNDRHLRWGTQQENIADKVERRRCARGEAAPNAKLTIKEVRIIRSLPNESGLKLGKRFGVAAETIYGIRRGHTWKDVA